MVKDKNGDEWLTQTEAADHLGKSLAAVNELVRRGRITSTNKYGKRLVLRSDVLSFEPLPTSPKKKAAKKRAKTKKATSK
jgi:hypothetical protein